MDFLTVVFAFFIVGSMFSFLKVPPPVAFGTSAVAGLVLGFGSYMGYL